MFVLIAYNLFRKRPKLKVVSYWCRIRCVIVVIQREKVEIAKPPTEAPIAGAIKKKLETILLREILGPNAQFSGRLKQEFRRSDCKRAAQEPVGHAYSLHEQRIDQVATLVNGVFVLSLCT